VRNFDEVFTSEEIKMTPFESDNILQEIKNNQKLFEGFNK
jgi:hypothetical protein